MDKEDLDLPRMRPRHGRRANDRHLVELLMDAQTELAESSCAFWACEGPTKPRDMVLCVKCSAMRKIGTVIETLKTRYQT